MSLAALPVQYVLQEENGWIAHKEDILAIVMPSVRWLYKPCFCLWIISDIIKQAEVTLKLIECVIEANLSALDPNTEVPISFSSPKLPALLNNIKEVNLISKNSFNNTSHEFGNVLKSLKSVAYKKYDVIDFVVGVLTRSFSRIFLVSSKSLFERPERMKCTLTSLFKQ